MCEFWSHNHTQNICVWVECPCVTCVSSKRVVSECHFCVNICQSISWVNFQCCYNPVLLLESPMANPKCPRNSPKIKQNSRIFSKLCVWILVTQSHAKYLCVSRMPLCDLCELQKGALIMPLLCEYLPKYFLSEVPRLLQPSFASWKPNGQSQMSQEFTKNQTKF